MIGVTTERFYCIIYPFRNLASCTDRQTIKVIIFLWIIGFISTSPFVLITKLEDAIFYDGTPVKVCRSLANESWQIIFIIVNNVTFFLIPFFVLTFMYSRIIQKLISDGLDVKLREDKNARVSLRARKQVVRTLILIIILFFVSMCPIRVVSLWQIFADVQDLHDMGIEAYYNIIWFARIMMYINSAGNPVIYCLSSSKFKVAFRRVLMRCQSGLRLKKSARGSSKYMIRRYSPCNTRQAGQSRPVVHRLYINNRDENGFLIQLKTSSQSSWNDAFIIVICNIIQML